MATEHFSAVPMAAAGREEFAVAAQTHTPSQPSSLSARRLHSRQTAHRRWDIFQIGRHQASPTRFLVVVESNPEGHHHHPRTTRSSWLTVGRISGRSNRRVYLRIRRQTRRQTLQTSPPPRQGRPGRLAQEHRNRLFPRYRF